MSMLRQHEQKGETEQQLHRFVLHDAALSLGAQDPTCSSDGDGSKRKLMSAIVQILFFSSFLFSNAYEEVKKKKAVAFVAEPDEVVGIRCHIPYHLQEVLWVLSNRLTEGQCPNTHMEPQQKHKNIETGHRRNVENVQMGQKY